MACMNSLPQSTLSAKICTATPVISKDTVLDALRSGIPDAEWLLNQIENEKGYFRFPPFFSDVIKNLKLENYPLLYASENAIWGMLLRGFLTDEEIKELDAELNAASPDERGEFITELCVGFDDAIEKIEIPKTKAQQDAARQRFLSLSPEEQKEAIRVSQHFYGYFFPSFFQLMSIMVHGEKLTSLVAQSKAGNDEAYVKAVQIDKRILTVDPYFIERYSRAQHEAGTDFYDALSYRLAAPPYRGKIRHKSLWLAFSLIDQAGLLESMPHREILEMCDEAGVGGYENRIQSVKHLSNRLREYREFQKRGIVATT